MEINKRELLKALEIVKPGLANKEIIEQSTFFAFMGDRVVTYNDTISISHPVTDMDLEGAIRAQELHQFLNKAKTKTIQFAITDNELKLKTGKATAGIRLQAEITLPLDEIDSEKDWKDLPETFTEDINFIKDSASNDMTRPVLTTIHVDEFLMEASDGYQIMRIYNEEGQRFPFPGTLIPAETISDICKIEPAQVAKSNGWIHFRNLEGTEISCRILADTYPETNAHFELDGKEIVFPKQMTEILERVMVFTKEDHLMDEEMEIKLKKGKLLVYGKNQYGWIKEPAPVKYSGKETSFWIVPHLLMNILKRSSESILGEERIKFEGERWEYIATLRG